MEKSRDQVEISDAEGRCANDNIQLLIGADFANKFLHEKTEVNGEVAWRTSFGWVVSGVVSKNDSCAVSDRVLPEEKKEAVNVHWVQSKIETLWEMESPLQREDSPVFPMSFPQGRYQVGLLWKGDERPHDNRVQAIAVANNQLNHRLKDQTENRQLYDEVLLTEYKQLGAIEQEPDPDSESYYMPHHTVFRKEASTTKIRVVFNASAAPVGKKSLNDVLDQGPSLLPSLIGLLLPFERRRLRFRQTLKENCTPKS